MTRGRYSDEQVSLHLQGVNLDDDRWLNPSTRFHTHRPGVWELVSGTEILPRYSGGRVTTWDVPGGQGERRTALMPISGRSIPIRVRFYPLCTDPNDPRYQREGRDPQERAYFLRKNMNEFLGRVQVARQMVDGDLRLDRTVGDVEQLSCGVYFETDWAETVHPTFKMAEIFISARNRMGTWYGAWEYIDLGEMNPGQVYGMTVPMGTANTEDARIALRMYDSPPLNNRWMRATNLGGMGFLATRMTPWARWWIFWTFDSKAAEGDAPGDDSTRDWNKQPDREDVMFSQGNRQGTSLLITPGIPGDGRSVGRVNIEVGTRSRVMIALRPKYF